MGDLKGNYIKYRVLLSPIIYYIKVMLQDRPGECIIKKEFTASAVDYLNQFPMFKEEKRCYIIRDFYNYCFAPDKFKCDIFVKYLNSTDHSPYLWCFDEDDAPAKPLTEQFTLDDARKFIQAIKSLWMSYCVKENREVNWVDEDLPAVPKGLLSIPSNIC